MENVESHPSRRVRLPRAQAYDYDWRDGMSGYILATLTKDQREAVIGAVCPWCAHKIGISSVSTADGWDTYHYIDGQKPLCKADALRRAIFSADQAVERKQEKDELTDIRENGT
jgi:hypothetical protein